MNKAGSQDAEKVRQLRSRIAQRLDVPNKFSEVGSTGGAFPFAKIHVRANGPHEVWYVPPSLLASSPAAAGLVGLFEHPVG